jgi:hypothetical protein
LRRLAVTGIGVISPLGNDPLVFFDNLVQRHSLKLRLVQRTWAGHRRRAISTDALIVKLVIPNAVDLRAGRTYDSTCLPCANGGM